MSRKVLFGNKVEEVKLAGKLLIPVHVVDSRQNVDVGAVVTLHCCL